MNATRLPVIALLGLASSCGTLGFGSGPPVVVEHPTRVTASGVEYQDTFLGLGDPIRAGERVRADYVAMLTDGTVIDSTTERGQPVEFTFGDAPIAGWNEGLEGIQPGGKRRLIVPAHLAYGSEGVEGLVPPGATLIFQMAVGTVDR